MNNFVIYVTGCKVHNQMLEARFSDYKLASMCKYFTSMNDYMQFAYLMFFIQKFGIVCNDAYKGLILFSIVLITK